MKRFFGFALSLIILCCSCMALAEGNAFNVGVLDSIGTDIQTLSNTAFDHSVTAHGFSPINAVIKGYPNLNTALMDLYAGRIHILSIPEFCAHYIVSRNEGLASDSSNSTTCMSYSMMTMEDDAEIYNLLNDAIIALRENGTIETLRQEHIVRCNEGEAPAEIVLPVIEGADTISVAVTGDIPPIDYISMDGKPAGFNVALLAEISKLAQINIEVVVVDSAARATALASDTVDAVFWVGSIFCPEEGHGHIIGETVENTLITTSYIDTPNTFVMKIPQ